MGKLTRQEIFEQAARKLRQDFDSLRVVPHAGAKGGEAEKIIRDFLNKHLPGRFKAGSGFIVDKRGEVSRQTDVVIYDALNCPVYRWSEDAAIFPNDNVAAVIEVKSTLDKEELRDTHLKTEEAKTLAKTPVPDGLPVLVQEHTLCCLFAFQSALTLERLQAHYADLIKERGFGRHIDLVAVLDRGLLQWSTKVRGFSDNWNASILHGIGGPASEGTHIALGAVDLGYDTLDRFLRILLAHLSHFRGMVDHPGFDWGATKSGGQVRLQYLTSICHETDPGKREDKLRAYAAEVVAEFQGRNTDSSK
jgi:hypothetical protein